MQIKLLGTFFRAQILLLCSRNKNLRQSQKGVIKHIQSLAINHKLILVLLCICCKIYSLTYV